MARPLSSSLDWPTASSLWSASLNPLIASPTNNISILQNISLKTGKNIINHGLGRAMTGWFLIDLHGAATVYRSAPMNDLTLILTSSADVVCSIGVF